MIKEKPVIGILATSNYMQTNDTFQDTYRYGNNYIKKIVDNNAIPLLIPLCDDQEIPETLKLCDGLLLPGGSRVLPANFKIIDYFYHHKLPILGICLGMQTLAMYSVNLDTPNKRIITPIPSSLNHWPIELFRDNITSLAHKAIIKEHTKTYDIFKTKEIMVNSVHKNTITEVGSNFTITIQSEDGLIEGLEYKGLDRFIIGFQFHPEILPQYNIVFAKFILECINKKKHK